MEKLIIVKVGGKVVDDPEALHGLVNDFAAIKGRKLLVHGGGVMATQVASKLGIKTTMVGGRRVTDDKMIQVVTMVYAGLANKRLVALLQAAGQHALGLTGADLGVILSRKRQVTDGVDYGWVGDPSRVNDDALTGLIERGVVPVLAPITHDGKGHLLNTNADTIAATAAQALASRYEVTLVYCFEKPGVLLNEADDDSVLATLSRGQYETMRETGIITGGMIPKLDNAFATLQAGVSQVIITKASALSDFSQGTHIAR